MTKRKLKTFEEKINAFLKGSERGHYWPRRIFLEKYPYLSADEVEMLMNLCREMQNLASQLAGQLLREHNLTYETLFQPENNLVHKTIQDTMRAVIEAKYPYLEAERVSRLVSHGIWSQS